MNSIENNLCKRLKIHSGDFHPVVNCDPESEKIIQLDFTEKNKELEKIDFENTEIFSQYIFTKLETENAKFGIGGYDEMRTVYSRSELFNSNLSGENQTVIEEPRRLHLGVDIWGKQGTEVFAPLDGTIHSFAFNDHFGDYGATIILSHRLEGIEFYTLYGHLCLKDIQDIKQGNRISRGHIIAHFGKPSENGHWPPHLHFQIINDIGSFAGDYPGVCKLSEREIFLSNCPDPDLILNMKKFIN
ncbi:MAG TPA: peptidoglycan DD-metalloendopeptidase family protein [Hanamia sp.]